MIKFLKEIKLKDYKISLIYVTLENPKYCIERINDRVSKGGHFVHPNDVKRRFYRSKNNFWKIYKALADEYIAILNSNEQPETFLVGEKEDYFVYNQFILNQFLEDINGSN